MIINQQDMHTTWPHPLKLPHTHTTHTIPAHQTHSWPHPLHMTSPTPHHTHVCLFHTMCLATPTPMDHLFHTTYDHTQGPHPHHHGSPNFQPYISQCSHDNHPLHQQRELVLCLARFNNATAVNDWSRIARAIGLKQRLCYETNTVHCAVGV